MPLKLYCEYNIINDDYIIIIFLGSVDTFLVDPVKDSVLTFVSKMWHYRADCCYYLLSWALFQQT